MGFLKLLRPVNLGFLALSLLLVHYYLVGTLAKGALLSTTQYLVFLISCLLMTAGGYIINDYYDIETDKINKPHRLLTSANTNQIQIAYYTGIFLLLASIILGFILSFFAQNLSFGFSYVFAAMALLIYSQKLKRQMLLGNIMVSILTAYPYFLLFFLLFVNQDSQVNLVVYRIFIFLMMMSFLLNMIRELIKDLEDINGDFSANYKTLPIQVGRDRAHFLVQLLIGIATVLLIGISLYFFSSYWLVLFFGIGVVTPLIYIAYQIREVKFSTNYYKLSQILKLIMLIGLLLLILLPQILKL